MVSPTTLGVNLTTLQPLNFELPIGNMASRLLLFRSPKDQSPVKIPDFSGSIEVIGGSFQPDNLEGLASYSGLSAGLGNPETQSQPYPDIFLFNKQYYGNLR